MTKNWKDDGIRLLFLSGYRGAERYVLFTENRHAVGAYYDDGTKEGNSFRGYIGDLKSWQWSLWDLVDLKCLGECTDDNEAAGLRARLHELVLGEWDRKREEKKREELNGGIR